MDSQLLAYLAFTTVLVLTPGATTAVVVRNVLEGGRPRGFAVAVGAAIANSTYAAVAAFGLAAVLARMPAAFIALKFAGAGYLALLGVRGIWNAWRGPGASMPGALEPPGDPLLTRSSASTARTGISQGLVTNLLNPAIATFYLTAVPSFLPVPGMLQRRFALYAVIHVTMAFCYHCTWVLALDALRRVWARPAARRALETLTGMALLALALRVAMS